MSLISLRRRAAIAVMQRVLLAVTALSIVAATTSVGAAESPTIATIDGKPLTLRELENTLLRREGADLVEEWVHHQLDGMDFTKLQDEDVILAIGFNKITRREIADSLLRKGVGKVRDELINIRIVEQAVADAGISVGPQQLDATWERMRVRFEEGQAKTSDTRIDFVNYLAVKEKMTPEQFRAQPGFRMLAGLQALVHSLAKDEWQDEELRAWFAVHRERYRVTEGIDLNLIALPYRAQPGPDGKPEITAQEREGRMLAATQLYTQIKTGQLTFAKAWTFYAKGFDPDVKEGGHAGFVDRQGRRDGATDRTRLLGSDLVATAFNYRLRPMLLPPMASDWGVELAEVRGYRRANDPTYEEVRDRVLADRIDETLEARTQGLLTSLRAKAKIEYASLPEVIEGKR